MLTNPSGCSKLKYQTKKKAKQALRIVQEKHLGQGKKLESSFYLCPNCENWHLSSQVQTTKRIRNDKGNRA